jgi:hypothetical protein
LEQLKCEVTARSKDGLLQLDNVQIDGTLYVQMFPKGGCTMRNMPIAYQRGLALPSNSLAPD